MNLYDLQAGVEARDDRTLDAIEARADAEARATAAAADELERKIEAAIADPLLLDQMLGDLMLYPGEENILVNGEPMRVETAQHVLVHLVRVGAERQALEELAESIVTGIGQAIRTTPPPTLSREQKAAAERAASRSAAIEAIEGLIAEAQSHLGLGERFIRNYGWAIHGAARLAFATGLIAHYEWHEYDQRADAIVDAAEGAA